jgi:hypothetical protein
MSEHDRLGPPPIEPLSDLAWSRIERGLWSRMDAAPATERAERAPRPRRWIWIAAPAFAAAAAAAAAIVIGADGGSAPREAAETARLVSGAAPTTLTYGDVHLALDADSAVVMERKRGAVLEHGAAWFTVAPRGERPAFVVTAGDTLVRVVGTKFRVARSGEEAAVQVEHGTVEVQFRGATTRLGEGQAWTSKEPTTVTPLRVAGATEPVGPAETGEIEIDPAPEAAPAPAPTGVEPKRPTKPERPASGSRTAPAPEAAPAPEPAPEPAPTTPSTQPAPADADAARYRQLEQLEVRNPKAAIDGYLALSRGTSRWAERALFAAARLSADRKESRARILLEMYLTRFPDGANVHDARKLLDHSLQGAPR